MNEPREPTYFIDRDPGLRFSEVLRSAGLRVERADDHFRTDTPDDEWLPVVMTNAEFRSKLAKGDRFVARLAREPKIFLIGDARDFARLAEDRAA